MDMKLPVDSLQFQAELTTVQVPVASGAGTIAVANNIATITFAGAHGLTLTPAAGTMANYFCTFTGVTAQTGVGTLNGPIFRILAIPSTTTIQIYTTVTAGTFTAGTCVPVFLAPFTGQIVSGFVNGPTMTGVGVAPALVQAGMVNVVTGANCVVQYNPDNTSIIEDPFSGNTLAVAPTYRSVIPVSSQGQLWLYGASMALFASGGAGTTRVSVIA